MAMLTAKQVFDEYLSEIKSLYDANIPIETIARRCELPVSCLVDDLRLAGIKLEDDDKDVDAGLITLYNSGTDLAELCDVFGLPANRVFDALSTAGVDMSKFRAARNTEAYIELIRHLHLELQMSCNRIAALFGTTSFSLRKDMTDAGIEIKNYKSKPKQLTDEQLSEVRRLYVEKKYAPATIANKIGCSRRAVVAALKQLGFQMTINGV